MPLPEPVAPDPQKPSRWSFATVLFALLVLIPGLCFGVAVPASFESASVVLAMIWVVVLAMWLLVGLTKGIQYLVRRIRR